MFRSLLTRAVLCRHVPGSLLAPTASHVRSELARSPALSLLVRSLSSAGPESPASAASPPPSSSSSSSSSAPRPKVDATLAFADAPDTDYSARAKAKQRRLVTRVILGVAILGAGTFAALNAFRDQLMFFMTPTQLMESQPPVPATKKFRLGGIVKEGSVVNKEGTLDVSFVVTDLSYDIPVQYSGLLPDLFREGQSVVVEGRFDGRVLNATEVLAKHDENYAPKEVQEMLEKKKAMEAQSGAPPHPSAAVASAATPASTLTTSPPPYRKQ